MIRSYVLLTLCVTLWGSNFVFGSILVQEFPPMLLAAMRLCFTSAFLFLYAYLTKKFIKLTREDWKLLFPLALIGTLANQMTYFTGNITNRIFFIIIDEWGDKREI